ncbi:MAG: hypothetical protein JJU00_11575, partial [Opitutales bacterium]|nr:hypothetical protein [Opitutales bacterium]
MSNADAVVPPPAGYCDGSTGSGVSTASGWVAFLAHLLFILAAWTVVVKYLFPVAFASPIVSDGLGQGSADGFAA